jgi:XTP/dITP diphosphohydrolase
MKTKILVATTNPGKMVELAAMLNADADVEWVSLKSFPGIPEVVEDGVTFAENAAKKALGYAKETGLWTIADDSGLVIDALDGAPGVMSARFSGARPDKQDRSLIDHQNIQKVLELMKSVSAEKRTARFVCSICMASPEKILLETQGTFEGVITENECGENGFGYDPILMIPELEKTSAQLTPEQKNKISHRGKAIERLRPLLTTLLESID